MIIKLFSDLILNPSKIFPVSVHADYFHKHIGVTMLTMGIQKVIFEDDKLWRWIVMVVSIRKYRQDDIKDLVRIWNEVVEEGIAFPQEELLDENSGKAFFDSQTYCGVAEDKEGKIYGLYILHPNNVGRCGHICNASYAVSSDSRGLHIGEKLVKDCLVQGKENGFRILQFNAVVATNVHARHLYERLGFKQLGTIPTGFRMKDGHYEDICPYYYKL